MIYFVCFWLGGMVACVLTIWGEVRHNGIPREVELSFEGRPVVTMALFLFALLTWPGFMYWCATRETS